jgi:Skp family chaperone for outer membrane proteins
LEQSFVLVHQLKLDMIHSQQSIAFMNPESLLKELRHLKQHMTKTLTQQLLSHQKHNQEKEREIQQLERMLKDKYEYGGFMF